MKDIITIIEYKEEPWDCECCGVCWPEVFEIKFNDAVVWERYSDGHCSGHQTEDLILNTILDKWLKDRKSNIEDSFVERKRHAWNIDYPGNYVASTQDSWLEYKNLSIKNLDNSFEFLKNICKNLPDDKILQVKMIALWIESETGREIFVNYRSKK